MKVRFVGNSLVVERLEGPKFYSESRMWYHIKVELRAHGYDVIKKEACKDGHLVSEGAYYIRSRTRGERMWCVFEPNYQIRASYRPYNEGRLVLDVHGEPFKGFRGRPC